MKITPILANKKIKELQKERDNLIREINLNSSFRCSLSENIEDIRPVDKLMENTIQINQIEDDILHIKHALNIFNAKTKLQDSEITIDKALVLLPMLNERLSLFEDIYKRKDKTRISSLKEIEYVYPNFKLEELTDLMKETKEQILKIQTSLDYINNIRTFDVNYE